VTRKEFEAAEAVEIEASIASTNAECDQEIGARTARMRASEPNLSHVTWRYRRIAAFAHWAARAPFAADLTACSETNS